MSDIHSHILRLKQQHTRHNTRKEQEGAGCGAAAAGTGRTTHQPDNTSTPYFFKVEFLENFKIKK
jgi:hypothetical protein